MFPEQAIEGNVFLITTSYKGKLNGCTAAWVSRASFEPKLVTVSLSPERFTFGLIAKSKKFAIVLLPNSKIGVDLSKIFGFHSGRNYDKFASIKYFFSSLENPIPKGALAYLDCILVRKIKAGDHILLLAKIVEQKWIKKGKVLKREKLR